MELCLREIKTEELVTFNYFYINEHFQISLMHYIKTYDIKCI